MHYNDLLVRDVRGDAGALRYAFTERNYKVKFTDKDKKVYEADVEPGVYEGYLLMGEKPEEAVKQTARYRELYEIEDKDMTSAQKKEYARLKVKRKLAEDFAHANRYILEKETVDEKDIMTSQFNVYSGYEYGMDVMGRETRTPYYEVQNNVTVIIHDLSLAGAVLDAAMEAGANTTYGIAFSSTQANEAYQKALTRAVEDAMNKAQVLAAAAGVKVGPLLRINASQNSVSYARDAYGIANSYDYSAKSAGAGTTISSGDISISAEVVLEYVIE